MTALTIGKNAQAVLEIAQWIRNGKAPVAELQNKLATMAGFAANVRAKLIFRGRGGLVATGGTSAIPDSLATRRRWRFPWHSSPYASFIYARFEIAPQNNGTATDPYCTLTVRNPARQLIGTATVHGGSSGGSYADVPVNMTGGTAHLVDGTGAFVFLDPDTEYTGLFTDVGFARLQSASVWEVALQPTTAHGYASNMHGSLSPIYDSDRDDIAAMARLLHKRSGNPVFHWCSDLDSSAPSNASSTSTGALAKTLDAVSVSATGTGSGAGVADMTLGAVSVASTGVVAATLSYTSALSPDPYTALTTLTVTITSAAGGAAQNNLYMRFWLRDNLNNEVVMNPPTTINADGWSLAWTNIGDGQYVGEFTRATHSIGSTAISFSTTAYKAIGATSIRGFVGVGYSDEVPSATLTTGSAAYA